MALLWNPAPTPVFDPNTGVPAGGAKAYFFAGGTPSTPLTVFTTDDASIPHASPVVATAAGVFPPIFIPYGTYGYRVVTDDGDMITPVVSLVQNPAPATSGGGGTVPDSELFKTGDRKTSYSPGPISGWVRENGKTIGNAGSGATERANDDTEALFVFHWNLFPNDVCPVSGGRGSTGEADFAAGKTIQLINASGTGDVAVDDMGGGAANRIQVTTTATTTLSSATATVASAAGLVIGMYVVSEKIPAGTTITAISGTTITLSSGVGVTAGTTQPARFSLFRDAQQAGRMAGAATILLTAAQLPANIPNSASSSSSSSTIAPAAFAIELTQGGTITYAGGGNSAPLSTGGVGSLTTTTNTSTSVSINPSGGQSHPTLSPSTLVYKYVKL